MKKLFCMLVLICFSFLSFAQLRTYDLASYTQPDLYRKFSYISPGFTFRKQKQTFSGIEEYNLNSNSASLNFRLQISKFTQKKQSLIYIDQRPRYGYSKNTDTKEKDLFYNSKVIFSEKHFLNEEAFFLGYEIDHDGSLSRSTLEVLNQFTYYTDNNIKSTSTTNNVLFKAGKGRIQNVVRAFHATQILNRICERGLLNKNQITHEQITALADTLGGIRNIVVPDYRIERNLKRELFFDFLEKEGLLQKDNYYLFAEVLDAYRFEAFVNRLQGSDWHFGIGWEHIYLKNEKTYFNPDGEPFNVDNNKISNSGPFVETGFTYHKPINHRWQFDNVNLLRAGQIHFNNSTSFPNVFAGNLISRNWLQLSTNLDLTYVFNSRTYLFLRIDSGIDYTRSVRMENSIQGESTSKSAEFYSDYEFRLNYYFSPWHTLDFQIGISHRKGYLEDETNLQRINSSIGTNYFFH